MAKGKSNKRKELSKAQPAAAAPEPRAPVLVRNSLSEAQGTADLVDRLRNVHEELKQVSQDARPEGLGEVSRCLADTRILSHKDKDVRLLAVCCVVDVLRIYAPEAPYSPEELKIIFEAIVAQLHGIATIADSSSPSAEKYLYVLENLATVKSCIILVELTQQGVDGAADLLTELFQALFGSIRPAHTTQVLEYMSSVLVGCLEECETYPQSILDVICTALLPAHKIENSAAYKLAQLVLSRAGEQLQHSISQFVNQVLGGNSAANSGSDLSEHIYPLIYELHKAVPAMVTFIIPSVSAQLQSEDEEVRYKAVALLGRLFASQYADYGDQLGKHFRDFLGRFEDVHPSVRKEMINVASSIITKKPSLRPVVEERLVERLRDPDHEIRSKATSTVVEIAMADISVLAVQTIEQLVERVKDKKQTIRNEAVTGLCKLYGKHVVSALPELEDQFPVELLESDAYHKLEAVPRYLLRCWTYTDAPTRTLTLQLLQETLIPKSLPDGQRATAILLIYSACTEQDRLILQTVFAMKKKGVAALQAFLGRKLSAPNQAAEADVRLDMKEILEMLPVAERKLSVLQKLHACKDKKVFRSLETLTTGVESCEAKFQANDDVCRRLGSQTPVGELVGSLISRWCPMFISGEVINRLVAYCRRAREDDENMLQTAMQLTEQLAVHFAAMFGHCEAELVDWLQATKNRPKYLEVVLKCIIPTTKHFTAAVDQLAEVLQEIATESKKLEASVLAVKGLVALAEEGKAPSGLRNYIKVSTGNKALVASNPRLEHLLHGLQVVITAPLAHVGDGSQRWIEFARDLVLGVEQIVASAPASKKGQEKLSARTQPVGNIFAALELWIVGLSHSSDDAFSEEEHNQALDTLFSVISSDGASLRGVDVPDAMQSTARRVATTGALELMRSVRCRPLLSIERWHELGWTMHDGDDEVRMAFLNKLTSMFEEGALNLRFMAYFALAATDDNEAIFRTAKRCLLETIFRFRATYARESAKLATRGAEGQAIIEKIATTSMPEYVVPYLLHLLSHHPDFPVDATDAPRLDRMKRCIEFMLSALFTSVVGEADNLSFLIQMVNTIHANYTDAMAQDVDRLHWLSQIMIRSLKQRIKTQDNLQQYPGQIYLPHNLYKVMTSDEKKRRRKQAASAPFDDDDAAADSRPRRAAREPKRQRQMAMDSFLSTPSKRSPNTSASSSERVPSRTPLQPLDVDDNTGKRKRVPKQAQQQKAKQAAAKKSKPKNKRMSKRSARGDDDDDGDDNVENEVYATKTVRSPAASKRPRRSGADYDGSRLRSKQSDEYIPGDTAL